MTAYNSNQGSPRIALGQREGIRFSYDYVQVLAISIDVVVLITVSVLAGLIYHLTIFGNTGDLIQYFAIGVLVSILFSFATNARDLYYGHELLDVYKQTKHVIVALLVIAFVLTSIAFSLKISNLLSRGYAGLFLSTALVGLISNRLIWRLFLRMALERDLFIRRRILAICEDDGDLTAPTILELQRYGHMPISTLRMPAGDLAPEHIHGLIKQAAAASRNLSIDEIVIAVSINRLAVVTQLVEGLRALPLPVRFVIDGAAAEVISRPSHQLGRIVSFQVQRHPLSLSETILKRTLDVAVASTALVVLSPSMLIAAIAIKINSAGPVLFRQMRYGVNGKRFQILKFRSMTVAESDAAFQQARKGDARVTWVGRIIRRSSIDELPQLWNVLRGEMSIVGPRPHAVAHDEVYEDLILRYAMRRFMKPGLTGWAQVNGSRGETPTVESMMVRLQYDLWYIDNWSIWLDISVICRTFIAILNQKEVY